MAVGEEQAALHFAAGEMGIGNSTPASCLTALLTGSPAEAVVGPETGAEGPVLVAAVPIRPWRQSPRPSPGFTSVFPDDLSGRVWVYESDL